ncbi:hypothetical protein SODALDRAFT_182183 [Sodiomyces alkalinus F11]|uniref:Amidoligase enzyme n=1 Tax=Sodiomyces alkalinus (strain CBS 110278 / VKM F-3762 / F11) TaxID=1314773 RepID=A0A3N2PUB9_SODAK|nr:hypothetical protein SODALDRAFT_182183 [Sodiomyces alkalinus F11]ROT38118.1 hypothetical protein SODALDRAFT_182183 [Sodiomyces alkalinus F11]
MQEMFSTIKSIEIPSWLSTQWIIVMYCKPQEPEDSTSSLAMSSIYDLAFGIEIELSVLASKKYSTWSAVAKDISARLSKKGLRNQVCDQPSHHYRVWSIVQEVTIPSQPAKNKWALELVSPIFTLSSTWLADLETIFTEVGRAFKIEESPQCSTHIHVSRLDGRDFTPAQLRSLAQAALLYEPYIDILMPPGRTSALSSSSSSSSYWCRSNRQSPVLAAVASAAVTGAHPSPSSSSSSFSSHSPGSPLAACLDLLDAAAPPARHPDDSDHRGAVAAIVETMCLFPASSAYGRAHGRKRDFVHGKVYKWNLERLLGDHADVPRTIEFRQPPGSTTAEDAIGWGVLTLSFVAGAMASGSGRAPLVPRGEEASLFEFWEHLHRGADVLGLDPFLTEYLRSFVNRTMPVY